MSDDLDRQLAAAKARLHQRAGAVANTERELSALHSTAPLTVLAGRPVSRRRLLAGAAAAIAVGAGGALLLKRRDGGSDAPATAPTTVSTTEPPTSIAATTVPPTAGATSTVAPTSAPPTTPVVRDAVEQIYGTWFGDGATWATVGNLDGTEAWLLRSSDEGTTWSDTGVTVLVGSRPMFADGSNGYVLLGEGGQLQSTHDGGAHWQAPPMPEAFEPNLLAFSLAGSRVIVIGGVSGPDGSFHFAPASSPVDIDDFSIDDLTIQPGAGPAANFSIAAQSDVIWMTYNDRVLTGAYRRVGGTWSDWTPPGADLGGEVSVLRVIDGTMFVLVTTGIWAGDMEHPSRQLHRSGDGGDSFTQLDLPAGLGDLRIGGGVIVSGESQLLGWSQTDGGTDVLRSDDAGESWAAVGSLPGVAVNRIDSVGGGRLAAFWSTDGGAGEAAISTDVGATWTRLTV